jgi:glycosyltransferase involved in cell wall biosynthesis
MSKKITMVCHEFIQPNTRNFAYSGGDRYIVDLARLIQKIGYEPVIFQQAEKSFNAEYEGIQVLGFEAPNQPLANLAMTESLHRSSMTIFHNLLIAQPRVPKKSIALSHGISFDHPRLQPVHDSDFSNFRDEISRALGNIELLVSVDANTLNVLNAFFAGRYSHKFRHIPNHVDIHMYKPAQKDETTRVLFPRRIEILRGIKEWQCAVEDLETEFSAVEWHTCGSSQVKENIAYMAQWIGQNPDKRHFYGKTFDEMPAVYQNCDIAVIPSIGCEGTSYSAIEAMACGLPVVTTHVGGLSQLVIDGYNGIVVNPFYKDIRNAIRYLLENPKERERMGKNARAVAEQMNRDQWEKKWLEIFSEML